MEDRKINAVGALYKHALNGKIYRVLGLAKNTDGNTPMVVYHEQNDGQIWVTDAAKWNAKLENGAYLFQEYKE